jgi:arylsulfatase A
VGHATNGPYRGLKGDTWEGGHRVPFIVRWPGKVKAGAKDDRLICSVDLMATFAKLVGHELPRSAGEDSHDLLPILTGKSSEPLQRSVMHHSIIGMFAIRSGN